MPKNTHILIEALILILSNGVMSMKKRRYSLNLDEATISAIDAAARKNATSRSAVARALLCMVHHVPVDQLCEKSPLPNYLGVKIGGEYGCCAERA